MGIAISEEDTLSGVIIKSLTEHGAAAKVRLSHGHKVVEKGITSIRSPQILHVSIQDGRLKVGDQILAVDDEVVVGYPVEKVLFQKKANNAVNPSVGMASVCLCLCVCDHRELGPCSYVRPMSLRKKRDYLEILQFLFSIFRWNDVKIFSLA